MQRNVYRWFDPAYKLMLESKALDETMFYPAYAFRRDVRPEDIVPTPYATYEEALEAARNMLCDDDDYGVFTFSASEGKWVRVLGRDKHGNFKFGKVWW